ncbi:hypothetical protein [Robiginitalea sp.]|uniref:hypothetical protein n=1 Tax=Robiginitalea sp. TaxID=1902411 RepID=UPI003C74895C
MRNLHMCLEEKYNSDAWIRIRRLPYLIAMAMEGAGRSGIAGSASERLAMVRGLADGLKTFPDNLLIRAIVPDAANENQQLSDTTAKHDEILDCLADLGILDHAGLLSHIFKLIPRVLSDLTMHETAETIEGYKTWMLSLAEGIAKAGKEGGVWGFGGEWFSEKERAFFKNLYNALAT